MTRKMEMVVSGSLISLNLALWVALIMEFVNLFRD
jgi:hypothetical protein